MVADCEILAAKYPSRSYYGRGAAGVPHSAQNFAVGARLALQFVQCFCVGVPHSGQNFAPT